MKIAVMVQCHKNPKQINFMLSMLENDSIDVFVHVDSKSDISDEIMKTNRIFILPDDQRIDVKWGAFSQVEATLNLIENAVAHNRSYDYYILISGQDLPLISTSELLSFFEKNNQLNYMNLIPSLNYQAHRKNNFDKRNDIFYKDWMFKQDLPHRLLKRLWTEVTGGYYRTFRFFQRGGSRSVKFYYGSSWWCISGQFVKYLIDYLSKNPKYCNYFKGSSCSDESFFQTLLMNSPFSDTRREYLHYIDWTRGGNNPKVLTMDDYEKIIRSGCIFARKFDETKCIEVMEAIKRHIERTS